MDVILVFYIRLVLSLDIASKEVNFCFAVKLIAGDVQSHHFQRKFQNRV